MKQLALLILFINISTTIFSGTRSDKVYVEAAKYDCASGRLGFDEGMLKPLEAYEWLTKETEIRNYTAQTLLALMFQYGVYVEKDTDLALSMLLESSSQGEAMAICLLSDAFENGEMGLRAEKDLAKHLYEKLNDSQKALAFYELSDFFYDINDIENEIKYLKKMSEQSTPDSSTHNSYLAALGAWRLGTIYYNGNGVQSDFNKAFELLKKAAEAPSLNSGDAMRLLSVCYNFGFGTKQDLDKAEYWLKRADETGDVKAKSIKQLLEVIQKIDK